MTTQVINIIGGVGGILFCTIYGLMTGWHKTAEGRNVQGMMMALTFFFVYSAIHYYWIGVGPTPVWMIWSRNTAGLLIVYLIWRRLWLMIKAQIQSRSISREEE